MNLFLPPRFSENVRRLALGIEPIDALQRQRVAALLRVSLEGVPEPVRPGKVRGDHAVVPRHASGLYALLYDPLTGKQPVVLRFEDPTRRYVPRRLSVPLLLEKDADSKPPAWRARTPAFFPGAAYDGDSATGLRGRVVVGPNGPPLRWARVSASLESGVVVGRAHGDDRGEFVLYLTGDANPVAKLTDPVVFVTVHGPAVAPTPSPDPLWGLPIEEVPAPDAAGGDTVSPGVDPPATYTSRAFPLRPITLPLGRVWVETVDFAFS